MKRFWRSIFSRNYLAIAIIHNIIVCNPRRVSCTNQDKSKQVFGPVCEKLPLAATVYGRMIYQHWFSFINLHSIDISSKLQQRFIYKQRIDAVTAGWTTFRGSSNHSFRTFKRKWSFQLVSFKLTCFNPDPKWDCSFCQS